MDRDAKQATLLLNGWTAYRFRGGNLWGWGMMHRDDGEVREDFENKSHGPTVAPLVWYKRSRISGIYPRGNEITFDEIPTFTFDRLWSWWFVGMPVEKHDGPF